MTDRQIVEWVARAQIGQALPPGLTWPRIADAMNDETAFPMPVLGELFSEWCVAAHEHARRVVESETWRADALK